MTLSGLLSAALAATVTILFPIPTIAQPNIVVIMTDDQDAYWSLDAMPQTRRLIKRQGVTFVNSFVTTPLCGPSRTSFQTGQAYHNHDGCMACRYDNSLGPWLQAVGYQTGYVGKFVNGYRDEEAAVLPPGWTKWAGWDALVPTQYYGYRLNEDGVMRQYGSAPEDYSTDVFARHAVDFIGQATQPFFLMVGPTAPHAPSTPAARHGGRFASAILPRPRDFNELIIADKPAPMRWFPTLTEDDIAEIEELYRARQESLLAVDDLVAAIYTALQNAGKLANTYIVFTSDNGHSLGSHRWVGKNFPLDRMARVPLMIVGPGIPADQTRQQLVTNLDVVPTIIEWSGAVPGNPMDGLSLSPLLADGGEAASWRSSIFIEGTFRYRPGPGDTYYNYAAVRSHDAMYGEYEADGVVESEFYNLAADIQQRENIVHKTSADALAPWQALLAQRRTCVGAACN